MKIMRPLVYVVALGLVWWVYSLPAPEFGAALSRTLWLGLFATVSLYLALLPGPLYANVPGAPGRRAFVHARRAFGVVSALFAGLHGYEGLFGWVGGLEGMQWWSWDYNLALGLGTVAWLVLLILAATSFDRVVTAMGRRWKQLHRLVYVAGVLIVIHAATVTIHIVDLKPYAAAWFVALALLLLLKLLRFRQRASPKLDAIGVTTFGVAIAALYWSTFAISHHRH
jgi:sulfoxide reductase heme-binding subunit YedZ